MYVFFFMTILLREYKAHPLKVYSAPVLRIFAQFCNSYHSVTLEYFHHSSKKPHTHRQSLSLPPQIPLATHSPWQLLLYFLSLYITSHGHFIE